MKYSVNLILWTNDQTTEGTFPVYLRITINRRTSYLATGKFSAEKYWNDKDQLLKDTHPDHKSANPELTSLKSKALQIIAKHQIDSKNLNAKDLKKMLSAGRDLTNIFDFAEVFSKSVQNKRDESTLTNYDKHLRRLEQFNGSRSLFFEDITEEYLTNYENWLLTPYKLKNGETRVIKDSYLFLLIRAIRILFNAAKKKGLTNHYPFSTFEMPDVDTKKKEHLSQAELKKWESFIEKAKTNKERVSSVWFLFACYSGIRVGDWHLFDHGEHVKKNKILLRADKNNKWVSMPLSEPLKRLLVLTEKTKLNIAEQDINETVKQIAKKLSIKKHLTTHCARHTFAVTVCLERGVSSETAAKLMGITLKTFVDNYSAVTEEKIFAETLSAWDGM